MTLTPKSDWYELNIFELKTQRNEFINQYYAMLDCSASYATQYLTIAKDLDTYITHREEEQLKSR